MFVDFADYEFIEQYRKKVKKKKNHRLFDNTEALLEIYRHLQVSPRLFEGIDSHWVADSFEIYNDMDELSAAYDYECLQECKDKEHEMLLKKLSDGKYLVNVGFYEWLHYDG